MPEPSTPTPRTPHRDQGGFALILVVIFSVLLLILVINLVMTSRLASGTGRNDALMARMDNHLTMTLVEVEQMLKDDLDGGGAGAGEGEGSGGANPLGGGGEGGTGGAGGESEEDPPSDSSQDAWFEPSAYADGDLTTYVWVEDEGRKFNILSLVSPDKEFATESKERLERLLIALREDTAFEISRSEATTIVNSIQEWLEGLNRNEDHRPRPKLKSDDPNDTKTTIPLHLDELLLQRGVTETMFYDLVLEGPPVEVLPGLESVLTIYTSFRTDPGDPKKRANATGQNAPVNDAPAAEDPVAAAPKPEGQGIKINVNTASRAVLRCLMSDNEISDVVIDAILRYRNEEAEEDEQTETAEDELNYSGDIDEGMEPPRKIFKTLEDLEQVQEFANLGDPKIKDKFVALLTTESDVFSIHMACMYKRNEERKMFVMARRRSVVVRVPGDEETRLFPIIRLERRKGLRVKAVDFPEEELEKRQLAETDMDAFSLEERRWNPFYVEFYQKDPNRSR